MTFIGALAGFSAGLGLFILFALAGATFVVTLFIPAFFVGFGAKFLGKPFEIKYKIIPGVLGMLIYVIGIYFVFTANEIYLALTPVNFIIAYYFSKATLTRAEVRAVIKPEFPRHFPASKNTVVHKSLAALDHFEYVVASGYRTSRYS